MQTLCLRQADRNQALLIDHVLVKAQSLSTYVDAIVTRSTTPCDRRSAGGPITTDDISRTKNIWRFPPRCFSAAPQNVGTNGAGLLFHAAVLSRGCHRKQNIKESAVRNNSCSKRELLITYFRWEAYRFSNIPGDRAHSTLRSTTGAGSSFRWFWLVECRVHSRVFRRRTPNSIPRPYPFAAVWLMVDPWRIVPLFTADRTEKKGR
jgi:hypothetical protein